MEMNLFHLPTAATPASQEGDMTLTSTLELPEELSVMRTENNESQLREPSPTGKAEQSISQDVAEESVIGLLFGSRLWLILQHS